jgi:hypothetical protein
LVFPGYDKSWYLTEEKFVDVLIIPLSWGSQLDGDLHQHRAASSIYIAGIWPSGAVSVQDNASVRGYSKNAWDMCISKYLVYFFPAKKVLYLVLLN